MMYRFCQHCLQLVGWLVCCTILAMGLVVVRLRYQSVITGLADITHLYHITAQQVPLWAQGLLAVITQVHEVIATFAQLAMTTTYPLSGYIQPVLLPLQPYLMAIGLTLQLIGLRLILWAQLLSLFGVLGSVGLIDGLSQRAIRRYEGGRESTLIYHQAKQGMLVILFASLAVYLLWYLPTPPAFILMPFALLFSIALQVTARQFKKYL